MFATKLRRPNESSPFSDTHWVSISQGACISKNEQIFLVTELVSRGTLRSVLQDKSISITSEIVDKWTKGIANGMVRGTLAITRYQYRDHHHHHHHHHHHLLRPYLP